MTDRVILHPAAILAACDAEAEAWAISANIVQMVEKASSCPTTQTWLIAFAKMCCAEGVYRGALNVALGKSLADSMAEAGDGVTHRAVPEG